MFATLFASILRSIFRGAAIVPIFACIMAVSGAAIATSTPAEAASKAKKVQMGLKFGAKTFKRLEQAGRRAQSKRGIGKITGGILKNAGRAGNKATSGLSRGIGKASRAGNRSLSRSKLGRSLQKGYRGAQRWQTKQINRAFRNCRGKACNFGKGAVKFAAPL